MRGIVAEFESGAALYGVITVCDEEGAYKYWLCACVETAIVSQQTRSYHNSPTLLHENSANMRFIAQTVTAFALASAVLAAPTNLKGEYECLFLQ